MGEDKGAGITGAILTATLAYAFVALVRPTDATNSLCWSISLLRSASALNSFNGPDFTPDNERVRRHCEYHRRVSVGCHLVEDANRSIRRW